MAKMPQHHAHELHNPLKGSEIMLLIEQNVICFRMELGSLET